MDAKRSGSAGRPAGKAQQRRGMNFDEAFERMKNGAAIARAKWKGIKYLFYKHDAVYAVFSSGRAGYFNLWADACVGDDWFVVQVAQLPEVAKASPRRSSKFNRGFADGLESKQAEARKRWRKG